MDKKALLIAIVLSVAFACTFAFFLQVKRDGFVAYNAESPIQPKDAWQIQNQDLKTFFQNISGTHFQVAYSTANMTRLLEKVINEQAKNRYHFRVLSVNDQTNLEFRDVILQDTLSGEAITLPLVKFIPSLRDPHTLDQLIVVVPNTPAPPQWRGTDGQLPNYFTLANPLHLFYPFYTSLNDMVITQEDVTAFNAKQARRTKRVLSESGINTEDYESYLIGPPPPPPPVAPTPLATKAL